MIRGRVKWGGAGPSWDGARQLCAVTQRFGRSDESGVCPSHCRGHCLNGFDKASRASLLLPRENLVVDKEAAVWFTREPQGWE